MKSSQVKPLNRSEAQASRIGSPQEPAALVEWPTVGLKAQAAATLGHHLDALPIGAANDHYEQEADRTAAQVVGRLESGSGPSAPVQATPTPGPAVQAKGEGGAGSGSAAAVLTQLPPAPGSGRPLEPAVRGLMERALGANLSGVRLHTGGRAQQLNQSLKARATTVGRNIYFNKGQYDPDSTSGRQLLAHELTHVLQQRRGGRRVQRKNGKEEESEKPNERTPLLSSVGGPPGYGSTQADSSTGRASPPRTSSAAAPSSEEVNERTPLLSSVGGPPGYGSTQADSGVGRTSVPPTSSAAAPSSSYSPPSSSSAAASSSTAVTTTQSSSLMDQVAQLKDRAATIIAMHQKYQQYKQYLQGKVAGALNHVADFANGVLSIVQFFDPSGITTLVKSSLALLQKFGNYLNEAYQILGNSELRDQLQPLLGARVDFGALLKEAKSLEKAISAVVKSAQKVAQHA
jgi:hypothetical protein